MNDDFNTPNAVTMLQKVVKTINNMLRQKASLEHKAYAYDVLKTMLSILGLDIEMERLSEDNRNMYLSWIEARQNKDFAKADSLRQALIQKGIL